jgi:hypothetical protein
MNSQKHRKEKRFPVKGINAVTFEFRVGCMNEYLGYVNGWLKFNIKLMRQE